MATERTYAAERNNNAIHYDCFTQGERLKNMKIY
jgi:hypothetical protein